MMKQLLPIYLLLGLSGFKLSAQSVPLYFSTAYNADASAAEISVFTRFKEDSKGYLWVCSENGLLRYDGHRVKLFQSDPFDLNSLSSNFIKDILEDKNGIFWISTSDGGLNRYNPRLNTFQHFRHNPDDSNTLSSDDLLFMAFDKAEKLWIGSRDGLNCFDPATGKNQRIMPEPGRAGRLQGTPLSPLIISQTRIYLSSSAGFEYLDRQTGQWHFFPALDAKGDTLSHGGSLLLEINSLCQDRAGQLWMGVPQRPGLRVYDPVTDQIQPVNLRDGNGKTNEYPLSIVEDHTGRLWMSGIKGVWRINTPRTQLEHYSLFKEDRTTPLLPELAPSSYPLGLFEHSSGIIALGSSSPDIFFYDTHEAAPPIVVPAQSVFGVHSLHYDSDSYLWFGDTEGLKKKAPDGRIQTVFKGAFDGKISALPGSDQLLINLSDNIYLVDRKTGGKTPLLLPRKDNNTFGLVLSTFFDAEGDLWIATWGKGLFLIRKNDWNPQTGQIFEYRQWQYDPNAKDGLNSNFLQRVLVDNQQRVWVTGAACGLTVINKSDGAVRSYRYKQGQKNGIPSNYTYVVKADPQGDIWVSTKTNGILRFSPKTEQFTQYDDLKKGEFLEFFFDQVGLLWVNHLQGMMCIDPKTGILQQRYSQQRGIFSIVQTPDGVIYYNTSIGLRQFTPGNNSIRADTAPALRITEAFAFDPASGNMKEVSFGQWEKGTLTLGHREQSLILRFATLDLLHSEQHQYRYALTAPGGTPQWIALGNLNEIRFDQLASGSYVLHLHIEDDNGRSSVTTPLRIVVLPPWWRSWAAVLVYGLVLAALGYGLYRYALRRQRERAEAQRMLEIDQLKTRLYTNITHEFRTPLTVILGLTDSLRERIQDPGLTHSLHLIERNGTNLLRLISHILNLSKIDAGLLQPHFVRSDVVQFLRFLSESFYSMSQERDIRLVFYPEAPTLPMDYDEEKLQIVVYNLVSNALKFTPAGGKVVVHASNINQKGRAWLQLKVQDTGTGIAAAELEHIFDRFYQAASDRTHPTGGTGIGLALTRELTELMGGSIRVASTPGEGTVFTVLLPVQQNAALVLGQPTPASTAVEFLPDKPEAAPAVPLSSETDANAEKPLLLLIEDNADLVYYISGLLQEEYQVRTAPNGRTGIESAFELIPDIIISDVMMPEKDGYEVCDTLKKDPRTCHIPIILLTAKAAKADKLAGLRVGADVYLEKPFDKAELFVRLEKLVELRRQLQAHYANRIADTADATATPASVPLFSDLDTAFLEKINRTIEEKIDDSDLGILHLCQALALSNTQVFRKLKALTGLNPTLYIRHVRLQRARVLLRTTQMNVSEVGYAVGFNDPAYFSRVFNEAFGEAPSAMRK